MELKGPRRRRCARRKKKIIVFLCKRHTTRKQEISPVSMQWRQRNVRKLQVCCTCGAAVLLIKALGFWTFSLPLPSLLLKVSIIFRHSIENKWISKWNFVWLLRNVFKRGYGWKANYGKRKPDCWTWLKRRKENWPRRGASLQIDYNNMNRS